MAPLAIATSKRKLTTLLDQITAASNTLPGRDNVAPKHAKELTAREKMDLASERAHKRLRTSTSSASLSASIGSGAMRKTNSSATSLPRSSLAAPKAGVVTDDNKELPNFAPWSQQQFLDRLKTFRKVTYWHPKPAVIGEVHWARRGWTCVDVNLVACKGGCERRVLVKLDTTGKVVKEAIAGNEGAQTGEEDDEDDEVDETELENALAERYKDEIVGGHAETCLWRKAGCKDDIYRLSLVRPVIWQPELRRRYTSLSAIADSVKDVTFKSLDRSDPALLPVERILDDLPADVLPPSELERQTQVKALDVALHGWHGAPESHADILECDACFQRIGLWMYQPGYKPSRAARSEDDEDAEEPEVVSVDLLDMHREHCPWRNARSQHATGSLSGLSACAILNRVISTYVRDIKRRSNETTVAAASGPASDMNGEEREQDADEEVHVPKLSRAEVERLDREREGKLRRLKRMFTIKRTSKVPSVG